MQLPCIVTPYIASQYMPPHNITRHFVVLYVIACHHDVLCAFTFTCPVWRCLKTPHNTLYYIAPRHTDLLRHNWSADTGAARTQSQTHTAQSPVAQPHTQHSLRPAAHTRASGTALQALQEHRPHTFRDINVAPSSTHLNFTQLHTLVWRGAFARRTPQTGQASWMGSPPTRAYPQG